MIADFAESGSLRASLWPVRALKLWHLLSLDAPTVAVVWMALGGRATGTVLPLPALAAMGVAVWMLYAADRLLDARQTTVREYAAELEERHRFHHRNRTSFLFGLGLAALLLPPLLHTVSLAALRMFVFEGALLFAYFILIHATGDAHRLPKEIAVGVLFAAAVFTPTVARRPELRLALVPDILLLAATLTLNCLFIYSWEHGGFSNRGNGRENREENAERHPEGEPLAAHAQPLAVQAQLSVGMVQPPHLTTRVALRRLPELSGALVLASLLLLTLDQASPKPLAVACAVSVAAMVLLDSLQLRLGRLTTRACADLTLLTPLFFLALPR